jgi:hypothetical protein
MMNVAFVSSSDRYTLDEYKRRKLEELNQKCEQTILGYFTSTVDNIEYQFSNSNEAQKNFDKGARAFDKSYVTEMAWTVYDTNGDIIRLTLDAVKFESVYMDHLNHIQSNIAKFRDILMPQVYAAASKSEVDSIVW